MDFYHSKHTFGSIIIAYPRTGTKIIPNPNPSLTLILKKASLRLIVPLKEISKKILLHLLNAEGQEGLGLGISVAFSLNIYGFLSF